MEGISPQAQSAWDQLLSVWGGPLQITSGYRDPVTNANVGGAKGSQHLHGNAFDISVANMTPEQRVALADAARRAGFTGFGFYDNSMHLDVGPSRAWGPSYHRDSVPNWAASWVAQNIGGGAPATPQPTGGSPMGLLSSSEPQGFLERLGLQRRDPTAQGQTALPFYKRDNFGDFMGNLGATLMGLDMTTRGMAPAMLQRVDARKERRSQEEAVNRTAAWLEANGRPDLADAVRGGMIGGDDAFKIMTAPPEQPDTTALQQNVQFLMSQGYSLQDALAAVQGASGGTTVNVGPSGIDYGTPPKDMAWARNPDGSVKLDERGAPVPLPLQGTQLYSDQRAAGAAEAQKNENKQTYGDAAISAIDELIGPDGRGGLIQRQGMLDVPQVGVVGNLAAKLGVSQEAVDVRNTIATVTSNIAFGRLQAMRDASATGGALGSVTENELAMLMNSLGAITQDTSEPLLRKNLATIRAIWTKIQNDPVARRAYAAAGAGGALGAGAVAPQSSDGFSVTGKF